MTKKTSKKRFFNGNPKIKGILSGILFAVFGFVIVFAFQIRTNVDYAVQYIQEAFYTDSGGNGGTVLIHVGDGNNKEDIRLNGQVEARAYCDRNGENCKEPINIVAGDNMAAHNIPRINNGGGRHLVESDIFNIGGIVMIGESDPTSVPAVFGAEFYVNGDSLFNGNGYFQGSLTGHGGVYSDTFVYSDDGYCDTDGNCHQITDFYTKSYITGNYYDKTHINNNFYTKLQSDNRYITGEKDPSVNALGKTELSCSNTEIAKFDGTNRVCASDTFLLEADVEGYIANDISDNAIPYDNGTKLVDSPLSVDGTSIQVNGPIDLADNGVVTIGGACTDAGRIVFDATNKNFVGCDGTNRVKLNN